MPFSLCTRPRIPASTWEYRCGLGAHLKATCFSLGVRFACFARNFFGMRARKGFCFARAYKAPPRFCSKSACALIGRQRALSPCGLRQPKGHALLRPARPLSRVGAGYPPALRCSACKKCSISAQGALRFSPCARSAFCAPLPCSPLRPFPASAPTAGALAKNCACACFGSGGVFPAPAVFFRRAIALSGARARLVLRWQRVSFRPIPPPFPARERGREVRVPCLLVVPKIV